MDSQWRVMCDMTSFEIRYVVFRYIGYDKRKKRYKDIEFAKEQPIEGFLDEIDAWQLVDRLNN